MVTDISIKNFQTKVSIRIPRIKHVARRTLQHVHLSEAELSIVFVTPQRIKSLNTQYLKHAYATDILTFNYSISGQRKRLLAEIVIAPSVAAANAKTFATGVQQEIELYVIHGILHLAGYDDHSPRQIARMRKKEHELVEITRK
jgi:probable rRNA maturation factor